MKTRPLILVTMDYQDDRGFFLKAPLVNRLQFLGADLRIVAYDKDAIDRHLKDVDGVIIPGGVGDIDPRHYGEIPHPATQIVESRGNFEMALLEKTLQRQIPFLGICWGMQMANVFLGGSLIQDIPTEIPHALPHAWNSEEPAPLSVTDKVFHPIKFSRHAQDIFGVTQEEMVNSTHHQSVRSLGKNLVAEAESPDGILEAASLKDHPFFWLVQWHPERLEDDRVILKFLQTLMR